jgi:hypothetical protein
LLICAHPAGCAAVGVQHIGNAVGSRLLSDDENCRSMSIRLAA